MKIAKMFSTFVLSLVMVFGVASAALAAPNDDVIGALKANHVPNDYIIQTENYLKNHTLSKAQADAVIVQIDKAGDIMEAAGTKNIGALSKSEQDALMQTINASADIVGVDLKIEMRSGGSVRAIAKDRAGKTVADFTSSSVKQTGINTSLIYGGMILLVLSVGSFAVLRKRALAA
jgi:hypothetical protein